jgi:hypothetical protein
MDVNANLLMVTLKFPTKNPKMLSINQNFANNSMKRITAHMGTDAYSDMNREALMSSITITMFT